MYQIEQCRYTLKRIAGAHESISGAKYAIREARVALGELDVVESDITRLRAALQQIVDKNDHFPSLANSMANIAKEALLNDNS